MAVRGSAGVELESLRRNFFVDTQEKEKTLQVVPDCVCACMVAGERVRGKTIAADGGKGRDAVEAPGDRGSAGGMAEVHENERASTAGWAPGRDPVEASHNVRIIFVLASQNRKSKS